MLAQIEWKRPECFRRNSDSYKSDGLPVGKVRIALASADAGADTFHNDGISPSDPTCYCVSTCHPVVVLT